MENKLATFADRLKAKLSGSEGKIHADSGVTDLITDLVDAHLDLVSAAHGSHTSGHTSQNSSFP